MLNQTQDSIFDQGKLADLKRQAGERSPEAIKAVAKQFESLFLQMMLKQMRQSMASGEGEGEQVGFYRGLADQQLASNLSKTGGIGLARSIEQQMARSMGVEMPDDPLKTVSETGKVSLETGLLALRPQTRVTPRIEDRDAADSETGASAGGKSRNRDGANGFVDRIWSGAVSASRTLGVPAHFVVGQAALETGWGRAELRLPNGESAHNLFNIKAGGNLARPGRRSDDDRIRRWSGSEARRALSCLFVLCGRFPAIMRS